MIPGMASSVRASVCREASAICIRGVRGSEGRIRLWRKAGMFAAMAADAEDGMGKEPGLYDAARAIYKGVGKVRKDGRSESDEP